MVKTQRSADIWSGAFLAALGLVVLAAAWKITGGLEERLPPRTLPYVMGFTILASGFLLAFRAWRYTGENPPIHWPDRAGAIRILVIIASLAVYIAIIDPLGMPIGTALYLAFQVWYLSRGRYRILSALLTGVISGVVVYYLFIQFLELSFPVGLLQR
jgi:putative tricarboxylic transport membrane protein